MKWSSQPKLSSRGVYAGDFMLAVNILLSGNNYRKIALLNQFLNIGVVDRKAYENISAKYAKPVIERHWKMEQEKRIEQFKSKKVTVIGDGRMDSPGHSAQYCTYSLMEYESKAILATVVVDKRETGLKSTNMEKEGLIRALKEVKDMGIIVEEVVTDGHTSIAKMMSKYKLHLIVHATVLHCSEDRLCFFKRS